MLCIYILILLGILWVLIPVSPLNMPSTYRDSGVFLYVGQQILNGQIPYQDVWDHKPPVIFYINAFGLLISNGSWWGVWALELVSLSFSAFIGFYLLKKSLGIYPALISSVFWLLTLVFVIHGGNLTTEYTLSLQFAALWLAYHTDKNKDEHWRWLIFGLIGGITFLTKQTSIGIWLAVLIYVIIQRLKFREIRRCLRQLIFIFGGAFVFFLGWMIFFSFHGSAAQFWDAAFVYNFFYASPAINLVSRLDPIIHGIEPITRTAFLQFSLVGYVLGLILFLTKREIFYKWESLLIIGLINLPVEFILISVSGRSYPHYYMTLFPVLSLFAGVMMWFLFFALDSMKLRQDIRFTFSIVFIGVILWTSFYAYQNKAREFTSRDKDIKIINYIKSTTAPSDYVLLWGAESSINYFAQRKSPSRFVYQYPLYTEGYVDEKIIIEFLDDIISKCPQIIVDTHNSQTPIYDFPIETPTIKLKKTQIQSRYHITNTIRNWTIYELLDDNCLP
jgi:4-amino-4-deoxy-L-arabinose transferase-like glycosyltransferase